MIMPKAAPFLRIFLLFGFGIFIHESVGFRSFPFKIVFFLSLLFFGISWFFRNKQYRFLFFSSVFLLAAGATYTHHYRTFSSDHIFFSYRDYIGERIFVEGVVTSPVKHKQGKTGARTSFELSLERFLGFKKEGIGEKRSGKVLVNVFRDAKVHYGDRIVVQGKLHRPYDFSSSRNFSYRKYLQRRGVYLILSVKKKACLEIRKKRQANIVVSFGLGLRGQLQDVLRRFLSHQQAGIMQAVLLGERQEMPKDVNALFKRTGTAHILAISGLHVGIVAGVLFFLLRMLPVGRKVQYILIIVLLGFYALMTGARPSVVRSVIMATVFLCSFLFEREGQGLNSLSLAGIIILGMNPMALYDIGFQLSFLSVLVIIWLYPLLWKQVLDCYPNIPKQLQYFVQSSMVSLSAWVGVAGLVAYYFEIVTPITILANLFVVPLIMVIVALGMGVLAFGAGFPLMAIPFALGVKLLLSLMVMIVRLVDRIPGAYFFLKDVSFWWVIGYYMVLGIMLKIYARFGSLIFSQSSFLTKISKYAKVAQD